MTKKFIFIILIAITSKAMALQDTNLDSLYNLITFVRGINQSETASRMFDEDPSNIKCGMDLVTQVMLNFLNFTSEQQKVLSKILDRPSLPNTAVSPNGFFKVHYTTEGTDAIGYDLNLLLAALDSAYNFEINYLGFPLPPTDGTAGGDGKYDVYVLNVSDYGYTQPEVKVSASSWTSFMSIDNDFAGSGFYTHGINAARVTVAHEFHHAIQMGNYAPANLNQPYRNDDRFFYELTSTSMEEFVYDDVNDYWGYLNGYFSDPEKPMPLHTGYDLAIWNIFIKERFGFGTIKNQWELIPGNEALKAIALSLNQIGTSFCNELNKFGIWSYYTGTRNIPNRYFKDAANFPLITPTATMSFTPPSKTYNMAVGPVANYFLRLNLPNTDGIFYSIVTNSDYQKAIENPGQQLDFSISLYNDSTTGNKKLNDYYSLQFSNEDQLNWGSAGILNNTIVYGDSNFSFTNLAGDTYAYPVPYRRSSSGQIRIAFTAEYNLNEEVDLIIFTSGLETVFTSTMKIQTTYLKKNKNYCEIVLNKNDLVLKSGVYIYSVKAREEIFKGKLVIFND